MTLEGTKIRLDIMSIHRSVDGRRSQIGTGLLTWSDCGIICEVKRRKQDEEGNNREEKCREKG